ncbi:hypothetical protein ASE86_15450 [Sphingomonas sp. Leaf33]|uniref:hypothetical protein n=1 Tax=Sphingomonas sp. Leaf33 TaxID=1736215 RepID=UPI0007015F33|nr:hypothetical protein [Sphingomonas sp. Leaf33]KQN20638.1 hypothetical protein ASE86_15450 [Sphingomonas sp. Leaf33]
MVARLIAFACLILALAAPAGAQSNGFDLSGPDLSATVTRGGVTLPLGAVPTLKGGDRLTLAMVLPDNQSARYLLVVAFLRGATNPPPKDWFFRAETWKRGKGTLDITVPAGAEQAVLFLAPEAGGGFDAVRDAVRGRPGVFVRAAQDLQQASLDRARLDAFVAGMAAAADSDPDRLPSVAPVLATALRIKLNADCLSRRRDLQATCLSQARDSVVLQAQRGATLTETLTGAPVDIAYRVAATREGGAGFYSPYIGLARDLARLFGAFRSAQYQYVPALALGRGDTVHLQLNTAPSFQNPRSVLVAPLPPIGDVPPPAWRPASGEIQCLTQPGLTLMLDDASLMFATGYARDLALRLTAADGKMLDVPLTAQAATGGLRPTGDLPAVAGPVSAAVLHGRWGFDPFIGPRLLVRLDSAGAWTAPADGVVVVGREHPLSLRGGVAACVTRIALKDADGSLRPAPWKATAPDAVDATLPLAKVKPGGLTLVVERAGTADAATITLTGRVEASRLDRFVIYDGDRTGVLAGARLDQVATLDLAGRRFVPATLTRGGDGDRLELTRDDGGEIARDATEARVRLRDGRTATVAARVAPPRPAVTLVSRDVALAPVPDTRPISLPAGLIPRDASLTFSLRTPGGLTVTDAIEIAAGDDGAATRLTVASGAIQRIGDDIAVARLSPVTAFGPSVTGAIRFRLTRGDVSGDWQPLGQIVRLPALTALDCAPANKGCTLVGRDLFTIAAVGATADLANAVALPAGFVGGRIDLPGLSAKRLFLRLRDAPDAVVETTF